MSFSSSVSMVMCSLSYKKLLRGEGGPVLPVAGLVYISPHSSCYHWGHSLSLWSGLLQQLTSDVSFSTTLWYLCHSHALIESVYCVTERRFARLTQSCVHFVTRDAKCGSFLTPARTPRYMHRLVCVCTADSQMHCCSHFSFVLCAGEPAVR